MNGFELMKVLLQVLDNRDESFRLELVLFVEVVLLFELTDELGVWLGQIVLLWVGKVVLWSQAKVPMVLNRFGKLWWMFYQQLLGKRSIPRHYNILLVQWLLIMWRLRISVLTQWRTRLLWISSDSIKLFFRGYEYQGLSHERTWSFTVSEHHRKDFVGLL